jgi:leucyl-tRNA synthetase
MASDYDFKTVEAKWQQEWLDTHAGRTPDVTGKKMYVLDMFPYPSGDGLHVGHAKIYTASDVVSRYLRMKGFAVLHPTGWDAFGLPTENSAIKFKMHPRELTERNIDRFRGQMQRIGLSYDWEREVNTTDPFYYKWTQWIWLQLYRMGLAYEATIPINWCPTDKTGLANEEVVDGKCERCGTPVEQKPMRQWMLRITKYAEQLLAGLDAMDWPASIIDMQRHWIGKSEGALIRFNLEGGTDFIEVFTTRPDTLYGVTYVVLAPEHALVDRLTTASQRSAVDELRAAVKQKTERDRIEGGSDASGAFTGGYVVHPVTHNKVPVWISDYVMGAYGTGAVMAVPAHDERDYAFAMKYKLPVVRVIEPSDVQVGETMPYTGEGVLVDSGNHSGQDTAPARNAIVEHLQMAGYGRQATTYKLRDWVFSRQRYWGEPIPIIHCAKCGIVPVPEADLPVLLPDVEHYEPTGTGESPLAGIADWVNVKCPTCPNMARRETNTMPQWAGSSWYFLRFADPRNNDVLASDSALRQWPQVDMYVGGAEHAVLHLLYARFWTLALHDAGVVPWREPFSRLRIVGLVRGEDGQKMSKSRGNVVNPDEVIDRYGADVLRIYVMFMGPFDASVAWDTSSIAGVARFLERVWKLATDHSHSDKPPSPEMLVALNRTIKRVSEGIEQFKFNTAIAALMEFLNTLDKTAELPRGVVETYVTLLHPFAPHMMAEAWQVLGHKDSIRTAAWPAFSSDLLNQAPRTIAIQVNGKVRGSVVVPPDVAQAYVEEQARAVASVARHLADQDVVKVVYVPGRLLNFVTRKTP